MIEIVEMMTVPVADDDRLMDLHVRIAQRADELAMRHGAARSRETDVEDWMQAEREILGENPE